MSELNYSEQKKCWAWRTS